MMNNYKLERLTNTRAHVSQMDAQERFYVMGIMIQRVSHNRAKQTPYDSQSSTETARWRRPGLGGR
jgi:hypothetical protein